MPLNYRVVVSFSILINALALPSTAIAASKRVSVTVPKSLERCTLSSIEPGKETVIQEGDITFHPYDELSPKLEFKGNVKTSFTVSLEMTSSCKKYYISRKTENDAPHSNETYSFCFGYFGIIPTFLNISQKTFESGNYSRGYYYMTLASIMLLRGAESCSTPPIQYGDDEYCGLDRFLKSEELILQFEKRIAEHQDYRHEENPEFTSDVKNLARRSRQSASSVLESIERK